jgi:putative phosphoribosyl transferase
MRFRDRAQAGRLLASRLTKYADREDVTLLGVPRGGIPVAFEVAQALHVPLDIFPLRKLGVPGQEELAFGAIASGGVRVLDAEVIGLVGISPQEIERVTERERKELERRERLYRDGRPAAEVRGRTVVLVDDGIATGSSILAAITALRQIQPARVVIAAPVAPAHTCERLRREVDEVVCVDTPESFHAIGQFYEDFSQATDAKVCDLLRRAALPPARHAA